MRRPQTSAAGLDWPQTRRFFIYDNYRWELRKAVTRLAAPIKILAELLAFNSVFNLQIGAGMIYDYLSEFSRTNKLICHGKIVFGAIRGSKFISIK